MCISDLSSYVCSSDLNEKNCEDSTTSSCKCYCVACRLLLEVVMMAWHPSPFARTRTGHALLLGPTGQPAAHTSPALVQLSCLSSTCHSAKRCTPATTWSCQPSARSWERSCARRPSEVSLRDRKSVG